MNATEVRIDKWLWAVRLFKTRSLAIEACKAGHIRIDGHHVKPSRCIRPGQVIVARTGEILRTVKVLELLQHRVGAPVVAQFMEDRTPPEEYEKAREARNQPVMARDRGVGRPTKRDRRALDRFFSLGTPPADPEPGD